MKKIILAMFCVGLSLSINAYATVTKAEREKLKEEIKAEVLKELADAKKPDKIKKEDSSASSILGDKIKISGQVRVRPEFRRNLTQGIPNIPGPKEEDLSVLLRSRFGLEFKPTDHVSFFIQGQDSRDFGEETPALPTAAGDDEGMDLHQGYIDITQIADKPLSIRVGRQEIRLGEERLVGGVNWSNVGRSMDGLVATYDPEAWRLVMLGAITDRTGVTNTGDGQYLAGLYGTWKNFPGGVLDAYYLLLQDNNGAAGAAAGTGNTLSVNTAGARIKSEFKNGVDIGVEGAVQLGKFGSNSILAYAEHAAIGYTFKSNIKPRVGLEYNYASGDNVASSRYSKFNNLFPTNHDKYGLMDITAWSNMHDASVGFSVKPGKWQVATGYHLLMVDKNNSATDTFSTYAGGPGLGKVAGHEMDLSAKWTMNKFFDFGAGYSHFVPGSFFKNQGMTKHSDFFYLSATAQFQ